jgi:hypothetical protein
MKNPMNPMFDSEEKYEVFRATVKIWLPSLSTLDGTDFANNQDMIVSTYIYQSFFIIETKTKGN